MINGNFNKKQFLSVFVFFIAILLIYTLIWFNVTNKSKVILEEFLDKYAVYDSVEKSGFPFKKSLKVNNITFKTTNNSLLDKNYIKIYNLKFDSFIFAYNFDINFDKIVFIENENENENELLFTTNPELSLSFYKNNKLKSLLYKDEGYKILNKSNITLNTSKETNIKIDSVKTDESINYNIFFESNNIQNFNPINVKINNSLNNKPNTYNILVDASSSIPFEKSGDYSLNISKLIIENTKLNTKISISGFMDNGGEFSNNFGEMKFEFVKFDIIFNNLLNSIKKSFNENNNLNSSDEEKILKEFTKFKEILDQNAKQNEETTSLKTVFVIKKDKDNKNYYLNGTNLYELLLK